jgi:peptidoglycan/LPS O-acetylase OafA/YrhL
MELRTHPAESGSPDARRAEPEHYGYVDALRGWAVIGVLAGHVTHNVAGLRGMFLELMTYGGYGVQLFFVVSAFTLCLSYTARRSRDRKPVGAFFLRRLFRIAPLFWFGIAFYLLWYGTGGRFWSPRGIDAVDVLATSALVHVWHPERINSVVPGGWTIGVEMTFYVVFPLLYWCCRSMPGAATIFLLSWTVALGFGLVNVVEVLHPNESEQLRGQMSKLWFPNQLPVFVIGILAFLARQPKADERTRNSYLGGVLVLLSAVLALGHFWVVPGHLYMAAVFALLLVGLSYNPIGLLVNRVTRHIGLVSFSCYIAHFAVLDILRQCYGTDLVGQGWYNKGAVARWIPEPVLSLNGLSPLVQYGVLFVSALVLTVAVSTLSYRLIERPGIRCGQWLIRRLGW